MNYTNLNIKETIEAAILKAEAKLKKAEKSEAAYESITDDTMAQVLYWEECYNINPDNLTTCKNLDQAYLEHDREMRRYYCASQDVEHLTKAIEKMREAQVLLSL